MIKSKDWIHEMWISYCFPLENDRKPSRSRGDAVGTSNGLVSRRERDVTLAWRVAWRRQSGHRKSGPDYSARSHVLNWRSRRVAK